MKKKINILGRKVPILAVMMALLVIGTASAALIDHYATLTGDFTVSETITVNGGNDVIDMSDGTGIFSIENTNLFDVPVEVIVTLSLTTDIGTDDEATNPVTNVEGITMTIYPVVAEGNTDDIATLVYGSGVIDGEYAPVEVIAEEAVDSTNPGMTDVTVIFDAEAGVVPGLYTIQVEVNPVTG